MTETAVAAQDAGAETPFPSLAAMRDEHSEMLKRQRESGTTPEFLNEVKTFLQRGRATGTRLDVDADRSTAQTLLDYWATALFRATKEEMPEVALTEFDPTLGGELADELCPYVRLGDLNENKTALFFGWQRLIGECLERLKRFHLVAIVGATGSGRSSLANLGLLPALKEGALPGSESWHYFPTIVPGSDPLTSLGRATLPAGTNVEDWVAQQAKGFRRDPDHLARLLGETGVAASVLLVDQFEQVFTQCGDTKDRQAFIENLLGVAQSPNSSHAVILVLRNDYASQVGQFESLQQLLQRDQAQVPMAFTTSELRQAIEEPAKRVGLRFDEGLVDQLLLDIQGDPAALSLLQFTLLQMWEYRQRDRVTWEVYNRFGAGRLALERTAEAVYKGLSHDEQETARRILLQLVRPGEGQEISCTSLRREEMYQRGERNESVDRVLDQFIRARLIRFTPEGTPQKGEITVAHESLVGRWTRLQQWLNEERDAHRRRLRLTVAAKQWHEKGRDLGALWRGSLLQEARDYPDLSDLEKAFVDASQTAVEQVEREKQAAFERDLTQARNLAIEQERRAKVEARAARQMRWGASALGVACIGLLVSVVMTWLQWRRANDLAVKLMVREGMKLMGEGDLSSSLSWFDEARTRDSADPTPNELHRVRLAAGLRQMPKLSQWWYHESLTDTGSASSEAKSSQKLMFAAEFSHSGILVVTTSGELGGKAGWAQIWNARTGELVRTLQPDSGAITDAAFNDDDSLLVTVSTEPGGKSGEARLWDARTGDELLRMPHEKGAVNHAAFSPDGKYLVTGSGDPGGNTGEAQVWDIAAAKNHAATRVQILEGTGSVAYVVCSADSQFVVTASREPGDDVGKAMIWNIEHPNPKPVLILDCKSPVNHLVLSPDGRLLVTASGRQGAPTGKAQIWDFDGRDPKPIQTLEHDGAVIFAAFSPDGSLLGTASHDRTARLWRAKDGKRLEPALNHGSSVFRITFSPDGRRLATASRDRTARVWDVATGELALPPLNHSGTVSRVSFSPDGLRLLTASRDTARIWEMATGNPSPKVLPTNGAVNQLSLDPAARCVFTATGRETGSSGIHKWEFENGENTQILETDKPVHFAALSPNGELALTTSGERSGAPRTVQIWNLSSNELVRSLEASAVVNHAAFSPDGKSVITDSGTSLANTGQAEIWNLENGDRLATLEHKGGVLYAAFSHDGHVVTASADDTAKVWKMPNGEPLWSTSDAKPQDRHTADVTHASFSRDGTQVVTASYDGTAGIWDVKTGRKLAALKHDSSLKQAAFSPKGNRVLTVSHSGTVSVWDVATRNLITILKHHGSVQQAGFDSEGDRILTVSTISPTTMEEKSTSPSRAPSAGANDDEIGPVSRSGRRAGAADDAASRRTVELREWHIVIPKTTDVVDLQHYSQLLSTRKIDPELLEVVPIESRSLAAKWQRLKEKYHEQGDFPFASQPPLLSQQATDCEANELWFAAALYLEQITKTNPADLSALDRLAQAHVKLGQWDKAEADYSKAIDLDPLVAKRRFERAQARAERGRWTAVAEDLTKAIELGDDHEDLWYQLALAQLAVNDETAYRDTCAQMIKRFNTTDKARVANQVAWTCLLSEQSGIASAQIIEWAQSAVKGDPTNYYYLNTLGVALYRAKRFDAAIAQLEEAMKKYSDPKIPDPTQSPSGDGTFWDWVFLAMAHHRNNKPDEARKWLNRAIQWNEQHASASTAGSVSSSEPHLWNERLEFRLLLQEAKSVIESPNP